MTKHAARSFPVLSLLTALGVAAQLSQAASAQTTLDLPAAVTRAQASGPDVSTARANLQKAQAALKAAQADPTSLITDQTQAQQAQESALATVNGTKLNVLQNVVTQYIAIYESGLRVTLNAAQVDLDTRSLQITQARLANRVATQLDVTKAQNSLNSNRQELADARAQGPIAQAQLAKTLSLSAPLGVKAPPTPPALSTPLATLQAGLETRLPSLVQAAQAVQTAQLQVKVASNDYTPARTLQDAQTALSNAQRDLETGRKTALTTLTDAYRSAQDAAQQVGIARAALNAQQTTVNQAQARLKAGTAAAIDVQTTQVKLQSTQFSLTQAQDNLWKALAALSVAAGRDVTGLGQ